MLSDLEVLDLMEESLQSAERARVRASSIAAGYDSSHNSSRIASLECGRDPDWQKAAADNGWYMTRAQTYAQVLLARKAFRG